MRIRPEDIDWERTNTTHVLGKHGFTQEEIESSLFDSEYEARIVKARSGRILAHCQSSQGRPIVAVLEWTKKKKGQMRWTVDVDDWEDRAIVVSAQDMPKSRRRWWQRIRKPRKS